MRTWSKLPQQMQYLRGQHGEFTIFNEFTQVQKAALCRLRNLLDERNDGVYDGSLKVEPTLLAQKVGEEADQHTMFRGICQTQTLEGTHDGDLVLVGDFRQEDGNLFEKPVDAIFAPRLEQGRDGQCGNATVGIGNEGLEVLIAFRDHARVSDCHLTDRLDGREADGGLGTREEELEDVNGRGEFLRFNVGQGAHGFGRLVHHHFALVTQRCLQKGISTTGKGASVLEGGSTHATLGYLVVQECGRVSNKEDEG
mmetsp:Transcript_17788/g.38427  ORF Transcript_17788/g.38427 Transcript_17788/m.38427 type:complete len:254 (-) Transcript_17788:896-1657(-)